MALMTFQKKTSWKQIHCPFLKLFIFVFCVCFSVLLSDKDPFSAGRLFSVGENGAQHKFNRTYSFVHEADPATLAYTCASLCQDSCVMPGWWVDAIHGSGVHRYCRWCWDSHAVRSFPNSPPFSIPDKGQSWLAFKQIRSWGCCNSHMFSWLPDLRVDLKKNQNMNKKD